MESQKFLSYLGSVKNFVLFPRNFSLNLSPKSFLPLQNVLAAITTTLHPQQSHISSHSTIDPSTDRNLPINNQPKYQSQIHPPTPRPCNQRHDPLLQKRTTTSGKKEQVAKKLQQFSAGHEVRSKVPGSESVKAALQSMVKDAIKIKNKYNGNSKAFQSMDRILDKMDSNGFKS